MNEYKEFEGKTIEQAIERACEFFNRDREGLTIDIIDPGSSGIFGLGGRKAVVRAVPLVMTQDVKSQVETIVRTLLQDISSDPEIEVRVNKSRIYVQITDKDNSGLIIGKDGQNIAAVEYLANRILAKQFTDKYYVQLDTGGYREKQDEGIRKRARYLAKKAKRTGKTVSMGPLSSYHRRIVHLALQNDHEIGTKSKGDGPLKKVLIFKRRKRVEER